MAPEQLKYNLLQEDVFAQAEVTSVSQILRNKPSQNTRITPPQTQGGTSINIIKLLSMGELPKPKTFFIDFGLTKSFFWFPPDNNNNKPKTIHVLTSYNTLHE